MTASTEAPAAARTPSQKRVPDFFIVGHAKCGTTALYEMLRRHPQIHMPVKEPRFFVPTLRSRVERESRQQPRTLDGYLSLFAAASPEQRIGEASPQYLNSHTAASRIAELQPAARIVAILREPADFLRSFHLQSVQDHVETEKEFRAAIALEGARRQGEAPPGDPIQPPGLYSDRVRYVEQLRRYHAVFPPEQVLVLIYEDFRRDNEATVRQVLRFLEVDDTCPLDVVEANPTVRLRSGKIDELVRSVYLGRGPVSRVVKSAVKALAPRRLRRRALSVTRRQVIYGKPPPSDEDLMLELRRRFKGEVVALSEYLDRDLVKLWGYDSID